MEPEIRRGVDRVERGRIVAGNVVNICTIFADQAAQVKDAL